MKLLCTEIVLHREGPNGPTWHILFNELEGQSAMKMVLPAETIEGRGGFKPMDKYSPGKFYEVKTFEWGVIELC